MADHADMPDGINVPEELERREKRLAAIAAAKAEIEKRAAERHAREQAAYEKKAACLDQLGWERTGSIRKLQKYHKFPKER